MKPGKRREKNNMMLVPPLIHTAAVRLCCREEEEEEHVAADGVLGSPLRVNLVPGTAVGSGWCAGRRAERAGRQAVGVDRKGLKP